MPRPRRAGVRVGVGFCIIIRGRGGRRYVLLDGVVGEGVTGFEEVGLTCACSRFLVVCYER